MTDTTQADALRALIEKVGAGDPSALYGCGDVLGIEAGMNFARAYHGSLDAAKALHEALLPEHNAQIDVDAGIVVVEHRAAWPFDPHQGDNDNPARAWLLAILRAKLSEVDA